MFYFALIILTDPPTSPVRWSGTHVELIVPGKLTFRNGAVEKRSITFLYTQTDEARGRQHVERILERIKPVAGELSSMKPEGGLQ